MKGRGTGWSAHSFASATCGHVTLLACSVLEVRAECIHHLVESGAFCPG